MIIKCPRCGEIVSSNDRSCPYCGFVYDGALEKTKRVEEITERRRLAKEAAEAERAAKISKALRRKRRANSPLWRALYTILFSIECIVLIGPFVAFPVAAIASAICLSNGYLDAAGVFVHILIGASVAAIPCLIYAAYVFKKMDDHFR